MKLSFAVILPAAGSSSRFGAANKLSAPLRGRSVLSWSLSAFAQRLGRDVATIVIPSQLDASAWCAADPAIGKLFEGAPRGSMRFVPGGDSRAASVLNALREVPANVEWVAVHDAARPLASQGLIDRLFAAAVERSSATVPAMPVQLTIKEADGPLPARSERTVPRDRLWAMQTPQVIRRAELLDAYERCPIPLDRVTDDVQLVEFAGKPVWLVPGEESNLKITTALDLRLAEFLAADAG